jgi:hypothetical protein
MMNLPCHPVINTLPLRQLPDRRHNAPLRPPITPSSLTAAVCHFKKTGEVSVFLSECYGILIVLKHVLSQTTGFVTWKKLL